MLKQAVFRLMIIAGLSWLSQPASAQGAGKAHSAAQLMAQAQQEFISKNYDKAIALYHRHLRNSPTDAAAWNQLAASYYHTGLPRRGLRYLKQVERKTQDRSYNYYYQGLCLTALEDLPQAKQYFQYSAQSTDEYGSRATFELGTIEYNAKNKERAQYWFNLYLQRYPTGVYRNQTTQLLQTLQKNTFLDNVTGVEKPDMEKALYRYNKLSLIDYPHYWFVQGGYAWIVDDGFEPTSSGELKASTQEQHGVIGTAGVGIGPWREGDMTAWGGYNYRQLWITDRDRISTWLEGPTDIKYFPLRGDLLQRNHQFYGDFRRKFLGQFYVGVFGRLEFVRIGSSYFPGPEDSELKTVLKISDTSLLIPWIGATYYRDFRTLLYFYMRKEINSNSPELSNKSYDLGITGGDPTMSLGISHNTPFPEYKLDINLEVFRYEFIYNDYWLDYTREGLIASAEYEVLPRWYVTLLTGYYQDKYQLGRLKFGTCGNAPIVTDDSQRPSVSNSDPLECLRDDTGLMYQGGLYWNYTQFTRLAVSYMVVENSNPKQKEFASKRQNLQVLVTMAFPSVKRVDRFVNRFADSAFTKDAD